MPPSARSLVLDLLSATPGNALPVNALIEAASLFDLEANTLRVAVARLLSASVLERDSPGLYRLGDRAQALNRLARSWRRRLEDRLPWDGGWTVVYSAHLAPVDRAQVTRRVRALRLGGFRALEKGLYLRPDNLRGGVETSRKALVALGLDRGASVARLEQLGPGQDRRARALWKREDILKGYRETIESLERSRRRLADLDRRAAMAESFVVGGQAIRRIVLDPLLPEAMVPEGALAALVDAMKRYDETGRRCWADFMRRSCTGAGAGCLPVDGASEGLAVASVAALQPSERAL
ncbi:MAG: PaaX family transcriptional regulator C-terminal domain-containing protein [Candidatus Binatia bacterium]